MKTLRALASSFVLSAHMVAAQPGDRPYSIVLCDDKSGFVDCSISPNTYQLLACNVDYLSYDYLQTSWTPDLKTLKVTDTLTCVTNTDTLFSYKTLYTGSSYLNTTMLLIIRNNKDTMYLDGAGEHLVSDYYGTQNNLPAVITFQKGMTKLFKLQSEDAYRRLQNMTHLKFWTAGDLNTPVYNPWVKRIREFSLNKEKYYRQNDTLILKITGSITSDGSCADGNVSWILQKKEDLSWVSVKEHLIQMDCGRGRNTFDNKQVPLFIVTNKINPSMYSFPPQMEFSPGKYRIVIFDDLGLPYFSTIVEI